MRWEVKGIIAVSFASFASNAKCGISSLIQEQHKNESVDCIHDSKRVKTVHHHENSLRKAK